MIHINIFAYNVIGWLPCSRELRVVLLRCEITVQMNPKMQQIKTLDIDLPYKHFPFYRRLIDHSSELLSLLAPTVIGQQPCHHDRKPVKAKHQRHIEILQHVWLRVLEAFRRVTRLLTSVAIAGLSYLEPVELSTSVVALRYRCCFVLTGVVVEVKPFLFVVGKVDVDVLEGVVNRIVALKIEKTSWTTHSAN